MKAQFDKSISLISDIIRIPKYYIGNDKFFMEIKLLTFFADFIKTAAMGIARMYVYHGIVVFRCKFVLHQPGLTQYTDMFPIMDSSNFIASSLSVSNKIIEQIFSTGNSRYNIVFIC